MGARIITIRLLKIIKKIKYRPVFVNYKTAIHSWKNFVEKQNKTILSCQNNPDLFVYNLEDFLEEQID